MASKDPTIAAIASEMAGEQYKLGVVNGHIQDDPHNRTRFAVIGHLQTNPSGADRTSLVLAVPNKAGAVYNLLAPLATHGVSMTRFESRPARIGTWEYYFYVDIEGHRAGIPGRQGARGTEGQRRIFQGARARTRQPHITYFRDHHVQAIRSRVRPRHRPLPGRQTHRRSRARIRPRRSQASSSWRPTRTRSACPNRASRRWPPPSPTWAAIRTRTAST
jgi:hypothetical protein